MVRLQATQTLEYPKSSDFKKLRGLHYGSFCFIKLIHKDDVLIVFTKSSQIAGTISFAELLTWCESVQKARLHINLNLSKTLAIRQTSLLVPITSTNDTRKGLCITYKREDSQFQLSMIQAALSWVFKRSKFSATFIGTKRAIRASFLLQQHRKS